MPAARSAQFAPAELLDAFPSQLDLSADGPRNVDERQRTLRDTIAWSADLLAPAERQLFTRLAVFDGGWTAAAAAQVSRDGAVVAARLAELRAASLIVSDGGAQPRFRMLETIREYAAEQLASSGMADDLRGRHARYYLELAESQPAYPGTRDSRVVAALDPDVDNFRAALRWLQSRDPQATLRLANALWPYWVETGRHNDGARWLTEALAPGDMLPAAGRARALAGLTVFSMGRGDYAGAQRLADTTIALASALCDEASLAIVTLYHGLMAQHGGDLEGGHAWFNQARLHWSAIGQPLGVARCHSELALVEAMRGNWSQSSVEADAAHAIYEREHHLTGLARSLSDRGLVALMQRDLPRAIALLLEGVERARESTYSASYAGAMFYLGLAQQFAGLLDEAGRNLTQALRAFRDAGDMLFVSYCLIGLAGLVGHRAQPLRAAQLCGAGFATQAAVGLVMPPMVRQLYDLGEATIRAQLDDATFTAAFERGQQMSASEAVVYALNDAKSA